MQLKLLRKTTIKSISTWYSTSITWQQIQKKKEIINSVGIIHALIENHENLFAGIQQF